MTELELIIQRMQDAGESQESINLVRKEYEAKEQIRKDEEEKQRLLKTEAAAKDETALAVAERVDAELQSDPGSLASPPEEIPLD